jgi:Ala-tRNA(Pro) deacylase
VPLSMLREFLDRNRIQYLVISHSVAYTAQGIAALTHTPGKELAKTVMVMVDGRLAMAVVPASFRVDLYRLKKYLGADSVELASELEFRGRFPDCETGSMPPFGNLYGMDVFVDQALAEDKEIAFNAGSHRELVRMKICRFSRSGEAGNHPTGGGQSPYSRGLSLPGGLECRSGRLRARRPKVGAPPWRSPTPGASRENTVSAVFSYNLHKSLC